jgi:hypothetical protein
MIVRGYNNAGSYIEEVIATIVNTAGEVVNIGTGATSFAKLLASEPVIFRAPARIVATYNSITANEIGELSNGGAAVLSEDGSGYNPAAPPAVTIRSLRGGSGASAVARVGANTSISAIDVVNRGSGYPTVANANFPTSATSFAVSGSIANGGSVSPGSSYNVNVYYGTGTHTVAVE